MKKTQYYYKHTKRYNARKILRFFGLSIALFGLSLVMFFFSPLLSWQMYFGSAFAQQTLTTPVPSYNLLANNSLSSLIRAQAAALSGVDYTNAQNWYPSMQERADSPLVSYYFMSIPKIKLDHAVVSTIDTDLKSHLVNYAGTAIPPDPGTAIVFGHSTLPQLFNPKDYKTIFAYAHTLEIGDTFDVTVNNETYTYKIFSITIVDADDTSVLAQDYSGSYLTIITCTPPGTVWKRLIIKSQLQKI